MSKFTVEQKLEAVKLYINGQKSYASTAKEAGVSLPMLKEWVKLY